MKRKEMLTMMELAVMLVVFAAAAVLCLRAFVWADETSREGAARDRAWTEAQSAAEVLKACRGDMAEAAGFFGGVWDGQVWQIGFDADWNRVDSGAVYLLEAVPADSVHAYLGCAGVAVYENETCLAQLDIAWQEAEPDA